MDTETLEKRAEILKILSHPQRLYIVRGLHEHKCCVGRIQKALGLSQTGLSQHLSKLKAAGIIRGTRNGKEICYEVVDAFALKIIELAFQGIEVNSCMEEAIEPAAIPCESESL